jgi:hypothetical protein
MKTYDPNEIHSVEDNVEAMQLIVDRGILHLMVPKPGENFMAHVYETQHHWCMASYHCGHEQEKDNGYAVYMVPKTQWTREEMAARYSHAIIETTEGITFGFSRIGDKKNN